MLHRKYYREDEGAEALRLQLKERCGAVFDDVLHQLEEGFTEFWLTNHVLFYHV